jgi:endonuclease/exonuclease/phosphatase family metal-dependent hydrolase
MAAVRVVAFNVHGFRAGPRVLADALAEREPDVALLNEVGILGLRLRRFARLMGMQAASGVPGFRSVRNAVLCRPPWRIVGKHVERLPRDGGGVRRGVVFALARRAGQRLTLGSIHLGLSGRERARHARALTDILSGVPHPVVIGGDLNEEPAGEAAAWIADRYWDAFGRTGQGPGPTFPAHQPRARIDYIFVSEGIRVERCWVGEPLGPGSDHLPVFADLAVGG